MNSQNESVEGSREATSEKELVAALRSEGLAVLTVSRGEQDNEVFSVKKKPRSSRRSGGVSSNDIAIFCRQFATLLNSGVNVLDAVDDASEMTSSARLSVILKEVSNDIRSGSSLSEGLHKHVKVFGIVFVSMIEAGEKSGKLGKILQDLANYTENSVKLKRKVKAASVYPAFIAVFFFFTMSVLVLFIIPRFESMFKSFGAELPLPTRIVMGASRLAIHNIVWIVLAMLASVVGFIMFYRTTPGRMAVDRFKLKVPIFGPIVGKVIFARYFMTFATLIRSGVDVVGSLEIASKVTDNLPLQRIIERIRQRIIEGSSLSEEMEKSSIFPRMVVRMSSVGEKSGKLDEMYEKMADYYGDEVDAAVQTMSSVIEPILIVLMGGMVGIAVTAMYLPIFKLASAMMAKQG